MTGEASQRRTQSSARAGVAAAVIGMADIVSDPVVIVGPDGAVAHVNRAGEALLGRSRAALAGSPVAAALGLDDGTPVVPMLLAALTEGDTPDRSVRMEIVDGAGTPSRVDVRAVGVDGVVVISLVPLVSDPSAADRDRRIAELEGVIRNIGLELQAVRVGGRSDSDGPGVIAADDLRNLSRREREVLDVFLQGLGVAKSAALLHVSEHTIRSHLKAIYRKLGVRSQAELMLRMRER